MMLYSHPDIEGIPDTLRQCERNSLNVSLELELRGGLDTASVEKLQNAIRQNTRITTVKFRLHGEWDEVSAVNRAKVAELVQATARLPNLEEIFIDGDFVPFPATTYLLNHATKLEKMHLERFCNLKACDTSVLVAFSESLRAHKKLRCFSFKPKDADEHESQELFLVNLLMESLPLISTLEEVELETNVPRLSGPPLASLCQSTLITKLKICPHVEVAVDGLEALGQNTSIQDLCVACSYTDETCTALKRLIDENRFLTKMTLIFHDRWTARNEVEAAESWSNAVGDEDRNRLLVAIAEALRANQTLTDVEIHTGNPYPNSTVLQAFVGSFEANYTLHSLDLFEDKLFVLRTSYEQLDHMQDIETKTAILLGKRIHYYTMLNRSGRGELLGNPSPAANISRQQWVEKLVEYSYSIDRLYFFLRSNPALCCVSRGFGQKSFRKRGRQPSV